MKRNYGESNILLNGIFLTNLSPKLANSIIIINTTSHEIAREFFEHRNYTVLSMKAFEGVRIDETFHAVYQLTVNSTEFWNDLENVSVCMWTAVTYSYNKLSSSNAHFSQRHQIVNDLHRKRFHLNIK